MSDKTTSTAHTLVRAAVNLSLLIAITLLSSSSRAFASPPETMPIWRIQVYFQTCDTDDAGTDDTVRVELNVNNGTLVDSPLDDWERGQERTYDLMLEGISRVSDIDYLRVSKTGSGGWCIGRIRLVVNGLALYDEQFPSGLWLDNDNGHSRVYFIDDYFMRMRSEWVNYVAPTRPNIVPVGSMRSRIQCLFGDFLSYYNLTHEGDIGFGKSNPIEISTLDANTWHVYVDLEDDKPWPVPDQPIDVNFNLTVAWAADSFLTMRPDFRVHDVNVDYNWTSNGEPARAFVWNDFPPRLNQMLKNFTYRIGTGIQLATNGDLYFLPIVTNPGPILSGTAAKSEPEFATSAAEIPVRNRAPLRLRVRTGGEFNENAETAFTVAISSSLPEDAELHVSFTLPAEVLLLNPVVEAGDSQGTRWLALQLVLQENGMTLVSMRDRVSAGKETAYTLRLLFQRTTDQFTQITTRVVPASEAVAGVPQVEAASLFRRRAGVISPEGTTIRSSRLIFAR